MLVVDTAFVQGKYTRVCLTMPSLLFHCSECCQGMRRVWPVVCRRAVPHQDWQLRTPCGMGDWEWGNGSIKPT